jgi:hypothetical protein
MEISKLLEKWAIKGKNWERELERAGVRGDMNFSIKGWGRLHWKGDFHFVYQKKKKKKPCIILSARHYSKCFSNINSFNSYDNFMKYTQLFAPS